MFGGWGTWIAEQASVVTQIATETLDEIIAEGKGTFSTNDASPTKNKKNVVAVPPCLWNVVVVVEQNNNDDDDPNSPSSSDVASPSMFVDENMTSFPSAAFSSNAKKSTCVTSATKTFSYPESKFWSSNPMQWKSLIKEGLSRDVNTFVISPEALIFESSVSSSLKENNNSDDVVAEQPTHNIKIILETILRGQNENNVNNVINIEINDTESNNKVVFPESFSSLSGDSIRLMLADDPILADVRYDLVPKWVKENDFWRNFGFRVYLLSKTESIDQAIEILKIVNDEHRALPSQLKQQETTVSAIAPDVVGNDEDDEAGNDRISNTENKKNSGNNRSSKYASFLDLIDSLPASQQFLVHGDSQRFHSNRSLKKKGFGVPRNANANHDASSSSLVSFQELKENLHATGETESWQKHFTSRAGKELENVRSVVLMLEKLIGEVEEVISSLLSSSSSSSTGVELPSIELIHSIAESCQFHKGRVAALFGELQSAPTDRVSHHEDLDVDSGKITLALQNANAHLGQVLIKQATVMKKLSAAVRNQQEKVEDEGQKVQLQQEQQHPQKQQEKMQEKDAIVVQEEKKTQSHNKDDGDADLFEDDDDDSSFDYVSSPVVENPSSENKNKNNNDNNGSNNNQKGKKENGSEFVAQLPWDDDDD